MYKNNNDNIIAKYFKEAIVETFVVVSICCILYLIEESATNIIVSTIDATSQRIYLDFKNIIIATYLYTFFNFCIKENREENLWTALSIKIIFQCMLYTVILNILKYEPLYIKVIIISFVIIISQIIEKISLRYLKTTNMIDEIFKYINIFGVIIFSIYLIFF